jgi:hypothetical protein
VKIYIGAIHDVKGFALKNQLIQQSYIMHKAIAQVDKGWDLRFYVVLCMKFDSPFVSAERSPPKYTQA